MSRGCGCQASIRNGKRYLDFAVGPYFVWFWLAVTSVPFVLFYLVKIAVNEQWRYCSGCDLDLSSFIFLVIMISIIFSCGLAVAYSLWYKPDPLQIVMELILVWVFGAFFGGLGLLLELLDIGGLKQSGRFVWFWVDIGAIFTMTFFQTSFHVIYLHRSRLTHLRVGNFSNAEILEDVMHDPELKKLLLEHMKTELSEEILLFVDEVDQWKANYNKPVITAEDRTNEQKAKRIYTLFIIKGAPMEINISAKTKEAFVSNLSHIKVDQTIFDDAESEVRDMLRDDILPRFLASKRFRRYQKAQNHQSRLLRRKTQSAHPVIARREVSSDA